MEPLLSPREYKVLKKTLHLPYVYDEFGKSDREICDHLCSLKYMDNNAGMLFITETGKAVLHTRFHSELKTWIPIFISSISLIVSIVALLKQ